MTRNIKALGLAIVAVAAMSMAVAASAQASEVHITTPTQAVVTAQQAAQHKFVTQAGTVTCNTATFEGTVTGGQPQITTQDLTLTATYSGTPPSGNCQAFGLAATVQMNGCKYTLTGKANTNTGATTAKTGYVDVVGCTAGKQIVVNAGGGLCTATIPEQHNLSHIVYSNTEEAGKPHHTHANITVTGITYVLHGALCPGQDKKTELQHDGTYQGQSTVRAYKKLGQHSATEHGHQFDKQTEGEQVGILVT